MKDHNCGGLDLYHSGHILWAHSNPFIVLSVLGLVLAKNCYIRKEPQHVGLLWVLQLVEKFYGLRYSSFLVCLGQNLTSLHSLTFVVQILHYTAFNCSFINLQFSICESHGLGGVVVDHHFNCLNKICILHLLVVLQRFWTPCDKSLGLFIFL